MKILHTSDWHLGKRLDYLSRLPEQQTVMKEIIDIANDYKADAVVIAGDIFDSFNPPTEAIDLFYKTVEALSNDKKRPIVVIAGNHDSPDLINAPEPLATAHGIILIGTNNYIIPQIQSQYYRTLKTDIDFIEIEFSNGELLRVCTSPFANEYRLKQKIDKESGSGIQNFLMDHWNEISQKHLNANGTNVLICHGLFAQHTEDIINEPDEERPIEHISEKIVSETIPSSFHYVALGHLHRMQKVDSEHSRIYYSGSPLAYSFSEANQSKFVIIADYTKGECNKIDKIKLQKTKTLKRHTATNIKDAKQWLQANSESIVELTVETQDYLKPSEIKELHATHNSIISIIPLNTSEDFAKTNTKQIDLSKSINELFKDYFKYRNNTEPNDEIMSIFAEILSKE